MFKEGEGQEEEEEEEEEEKEEEEEFIQKETCPKCLPAGFKYTGRNWSNTVCSFYLQVSISRADTV
jgi:hypothetical protein